MEIGVGVAAEGDDAFRCSRELGEGRLLRRRFRDSIVVHRGEYVVQYAA